MVKAHTVECKDLPLVEDVIRELIEQGGASRIQLINLQCALDEALFSIVEGYSNRDRAHEAYQQVKAVRERIAAMLRIPNQPQENTNGTTAGAMGNAN